MLTYDKFVYVDPTKTGSSSIAQALNEHFSFKYGERHQVYNRTRLPAFMSVRNPYERMLSIYKFFMFKHFDVIECEKLTLNDFIKHACALSTNRKRLENLWYIPMHYYYSAGMEVVHLENLQKEFDNLSFINKVIKIPHINKKSKVLNEITLNNMTHESIEMINDKYELDFYRFDYTMKTEQNKFKEN